LILCRFALGLACTSRRYFENNAAQCEANVRQRNRSTMETELRKIKELSAKYEIPHDGLRIPIVTAT